jgi:hypothetical protein
MSDENVITNSQFSFHAENGPDYCGKATDLDLSCRAQLKKRAMIDARVIADAYGMRGIGIAVQKGKTAVEK